MKRTIQGEKEDFCKANYKSLQDAKTQLLALLTEIMMTEAGFIIDQSLEECKRKAQDLKKQKEYIERQEKFINVKRVKITDKN